ncbi:MAG: NAD-dependent epimerase/dehydratase family protein [Proteobacteria bacterium]|nr:NAD-dependent epimerase/dehydratase family protein [Pseudomonadota bacterium]
MKVLVTGATGFIGWHCASFLRDRGLTVSALLRPPSDETKLPKGVAGIRGDFSSVKSLAAAVHGIDAVVHCAGVVRAVSPASYWKANVDSTENLCLACRDQKVDRLIFISSLTAGGPSGRDKPRDESDADYPLTHYGVSKNSAESVVKSLIRDSTVLRLCAVYGPRERDILRMFKLVAEKGLDIRPKGDSPLLSFIEGREVAKAVLSALKSDVTKKKTYYISDGNIYEWDDFLTCVEEAVGRKARRIFIPMWMADTYAMFADGFSKITRKPSLINRERILILRQEAWTCSPARFSDDTGFQPDDDLKKGVFATAEWYREKGWLK